MIETTKTLNNFKNDLISQLEMIYQRRGKPDCTATLLIATDTLDLALSAWVNYFEK